MAAAKYFPIVCFSFFMRFEMCEPLQKYKKKKVINTI
jgi:hypothetical protein